MSGFGRALRAELYALRRRRWRWGLLVLAAAVLLRVAAGLLLSRLSGGGAGADSGLGDLPRAHENFWPRFAEAARFGLVLAEIGVLVLVSGTLPREIASCAVRDPLTRRISRAAYMSAKAVVALLLPLLLAAVAVGSAALGAGLCYQRGHIVEAPITLDEPDAAAVAEYQAFLAAHELRPDQLAAYVELTHDGAEPEDAARRLGIAPLELDPDVLYRWPVPFLVRYEDEIRDEVLGALLRGVPALLATGLAALAASALLANVLLALAAALGTVLLGAVFLAPALDHGAWWLFPDWLPGMGHDSLLAQAQLLADGYSDVTPPPPQALRLALLAPCAAGVLFLILSQLAFRRRRL